jgi:hypothetical protein
MAHTGEDDRVPVPSWPTCRTDPGLVTRCNGRQVEGFDLCLAHLQPAQLEQVLQRFGPGADLEAPGTSINAALLERLLSAVAGANGAPAFGVVNFAQAQFPENARFTSAQFSGNAVFEGAQFSGDAEFRGAQFSGNAVFEGAQFSGDAKFRGAQFSRNAVFEGAQFSEDAEFHRAQFSRDAKFNRAQFSREATFMSAQFSGAAAMFQSAQFKGKASFPGAHFERNARFDGTQFSRYTTFDGARFRREAWFRGAHFSEDTHFFSAQLSGNAVFEGAQFSGDVDFRNAQFSANAVFKGSQFSGAARFSGAHFSGAAGFADVRFEKTASLGPLTAGALVLRRAVFVRPIVLEAAAVSIICSDATWEAGVTMRLRHAKVDLERATFTVPSFVAGADQPFELPNSDRLSESEIMSRPVRRVDSRDDSWAPAVTSLQGVDAFNLSLTDVDLSQCRFAGARLLDQLRLEGNCVFGHPPQRLHVGWAWPPVWRWSTRQSLAEERIWRATTPKFSGWADTRSDAPAGVRPERLAGLYRQLRKAQEDAKNEPGAADFYYGEMEMRRHAHTTPAAERAIVWLYWLVSGYGLRAIRSLAALVIVGTIVTVALVGWGLAASTPPQHLTGTITTTRHNPAQIDATLQTTAPELPSASQRWTTQRTRTSLQITLESIAFRSTDEPLTPAGVWITIAARILGPILLALALLAVRNRVKR